MAVGEEQSAHARLEEVLAAGVKRVRVHFTDLLGVSRNKVIPTTALEEAVEDGINFSVGALCVDHAGEVVEGTVLGDELNFCDMQGIYVL